MTMQDEVVSMVSVKCNRTRYLGGNSLASSSRLWRALHRTEYVSNNTFDEHLQGDRKSTNVVVLDLHFLKGLLLKLLPIQPRVRNTHETNNFMIPQKQVVVFFLRKVA